jgi:hypothetical protein
MPVYGFPCFDSTGSGLMHKPTKPVVVDLRAQFPLP